MNHLDHKLSQIIKWLNYKRPCKLIFMRKMCIISETPMAFSSMHSFTAFTGVFSFKVADVKVGDFHIKIILNLNFNLNLSYHTTNK